MKTSEIINEIMIENNLSQERLAKLLNVSQKAVSNWINDIDTPKASSIMLIYNKFGITPNELLGVEEPRNFKPISIKNSFNNNKGNISVR
jgi:transcriptional regulator with XRE-family HTH domain